MVEFALWIGPYLLMLWFILEMGFGLFHCSNLGHTTDGLTRHLATRLGTVWHTRTLSGSPWNGNCNDYLRTEGEGYLRAHYPAEYSMIDSSVRYYFGRTMTDDSPPTALVTVAQAPYAVLRIVGRVRPSFGIGGILLPALLSRESSMVVEYNGPACNDYP
jgi:hypothetical protein